MKNKIVLIIALGMISCQKTPAISSIQLLEGTWEFVGYKNHSTCELKDKKITIAFSIENG